MKKQQTAKSSSSLSEIPQWVKDRKLVKPTARKQGGQQVDNAPNISQSMANLKRSTLKGKFGGKLQKDGEYDKMDYNNLPARWFDQDKKMRMRQKAKVPFQKPPMRPYPTHLPATKRRRHFGKGIEHSDARVKLLRVYDAEIDYYASKGIYDTASDSNSGIGIGSSNFGNEKIYLKDGTQMMDNAGDTFKSNTEDTSAVSTSLEQPLKHTDEFSRTIATSANGAAEDEDFLRLDMSKIPLDRFDNPSMFETKSPEEWLKSTATGKSPYYAGGVWSWRPCQIEEYDAYTQKYKIKFTELGKSKFVKRLNLQFDGETDKTFQNRLKYANNSREAAKAIIRYDYFLENQPDNSVESIPDWTLNGIARRIGVALKTLESALVKELVEDVGRRYKRACKKLFCTSH